MKRLLVVQHSYSECLGGALDRMRERRKPPVFVLNPVNRKSGIEEPTSPGGHSLRYQLTIDDSRLTIHEPRQ